MIFEITQGDTEPALRALLKDANGKPAIIQVTDVVTFRMRPVVKGLRSPIDNVAAVNDGPSGDVEYRWAGPDTVTPGVYEAEFHVTGLGGFEKTFPNGEFITVHIKAAAT